MSNGSRTIFRAAHIVSLNLGWRYPLFLCGFGLRDESVNAQEQAAQARLRNLQVLKDVPPDQLIPATQFVSASLGVECEFCHVRDGSDKDDKHLPGHPEAPKSSSGALRATFPHCHQSTVEI
jgi:hypothetical protein